MSRPRVLIVEDDRLQYDYLAGELRDHLYGTLEIDHIETEHEFYSCIDQIAQNPPDLVLMDVMLRWTNPAPTMPEAPPEVQRERFFRAGIRCVRRLREKEATRHLPVILYTILGERDLEKDFEETATLKFVQKTANTEDLVRTILQMAPALGR